MSKITTLPVADPVTGAETVLLVQGGASKRAAFAGLLASAAPSPFDPDLWNLPVSIRNDDIVTPTTTSLATDDHGFTIADGARFYFTPAIGNFGLSVGDTMRMAFRLLSGAAAPTSITFRNGATLISTVNFILSNGSYLAEAVVPATTTNIRMDWTNGSGGAVKISRPRIARRATQSDLPVKDRVRLASLNSDPGQLANFFARAATVGTTAGAGVATINANGSVTVPGGALVSIRPPNHAGRAVGANVTLLCRSGTRLIRNINARFIGATTGTTTAMMRPIGDGWWVYSGPIPAIVGSTSAISTYFEVDNRAAGIAAYAPADAVIDSFMAFDGLDIPDGLIAPAPDTYPDDEIVVTQGVDAFTIYQRSGENAKYTGWTFARYNVPAYPERKVGWRVTGHEKATRTGDTAFAAGIAITDNGEFETAIKENGKADFMGGATHGDAVETRALQAFIDGNKIVPDGATAYRARVVEMIQRQTLFEVGNAVDTPTIDLVTRWFWERGLLRIGWRGEFLRAITLGAGSYLGMYPALRNSSGTLISGTAFAHPLYEPHDISASGHAFPNGNHRRIILTGNGGVKIDIEVTKGWVEGTSRTFLEDTAVPDRNKVYFMPWGASAVAIAAGQTFEWEVTYRISAV